MVGPDYAVRSTGPDHDKRFLATVIVAGEVIGEGDGRSKKVGRAGRGVGPRCACLTAN